MALTQVFSCEFCEISKNFLIYKRSFDTVNHEVLPKKLEIYDIRGITKKWFKSFLKDRKQYITIQGIKSDQELIDYGVTQGFVLGPLLFIIFINDFHSAIHFSAVHHFADDTNLLLSDCFLMQLNKHGNRDLKLASE